MQLHIVQFMGNALIKQINGRPCAVPLNILRIVTHMGAGEVRYLTSDGYVGVHIDGDPERRVDEIHFDHLSEQAQFITLCSMADPREPTPAPAPAAPARSRRVTLAEYGKLISAIGVTARVAVA